MRNVGLKALAGLVLGAGGVALLGWPEQAPVWVLLGLLSTAVPLGMAWRASSGSALRPAVLWASGAMALAALGQGFGWGEPLESGRPACGHFTYLASLSSLAALMSVFNARRPGSGAWAILMGLLVLVFLIPWLEGIGLAARARGLDRLWLEAPWSWFFLLLALAGGTNFLPTRYGPSVLAVLAALTLEYVALAYPALEIGWRGRIWSMVCWGLALGIWLALFRARPKSEELPTGLERLWLTFRDHWGVVWSLRVQERFNRSAKAAGWPIRLSWYGVVTEPSASATEDLASVLPAAEAMLKGLLRRFAEPGRLDAWTAGGASGTV